MIMEIPSSLRGQEVKSFIQLEFNEMEYCPNPDCQNRGWSPIQVGEDDFEQEQCKFCYTTSYSCFYIKNFLLQEITSSNIGEVMEKYFGWNLVSTNGEGKEPHYVNAENNHLWIADKQCEIWVQGQKGIYNNIPTILETLISNLLQAGITLTWK